MNIVNPNDTQHQLKIIPRFYPEGDVLLGLTDEASGEVYTVNVTPTLNNGYMFLEFEKTFNNNDNYKVTVLDGVAVVYKGKLFATKQANETQDYKISKDVFII